MPQMCNLIRNDLLSKDVICNKSSLVVPPIFKKNTYNFLRSSLFLTYEVNVTNTENVNIKYKTGVAKIQNGKK